MIHGIHEKIRYFDSLMTGEYHYQTPSLFNLLIMKFHYPCLSYPD